MKGFRPMLAAELNESAIKIYLEKSPLLISPKVDGIRGTVLNGAVYSRSGKLLPNLQLQRMFGRYEHLDGEFVATEPNHPLVYKKAFTGCMKKDAETDLHFWVFDHVQEQNIPYVDRFAKFQAQSTDRVHVLPQRLIHTFDQLLEIEENLLAEGFEGAMVRTPTGHYLNNRARGVDLMKIKRVVEVELPILDILEGEENTNEAFIDELGYTKRSTAKEGKVPNGRAGKFVCPWEDTTFKVSPGTFTHDELAEILRNKEKYIGKYLLKVHLMGYGTDARPRQPRAHGFRALEDM